MSRGVLVVLVVGCVLASVTLMARADTETETDMVDSSHITCKTGYYKKCSTVAGKQVCSCHQSDILKMLEGTKEHHLKQAKVHHAKWKYHVRKAKYHTRRHRNYLKAAARHKKKRDLHRKLAKKFAAKAKKHKHAAHVASKKAKAAAAKGTALPSTVAALKKKAAAHLAKAKKYRTKAQLHAELQASYTTKYYTAQQSAEIQKSQAMAHNLMAQSELKLYNSAMAQWKKLTTEESGFKAKTTLYTSKSNQNHRVYLSSDKHAKKYRTKRDAEQKKQNEYAAAVAKWSAKRAGHLAAMKAAQAIMNKHLAAAKAAGAKVTLYTSKSAKAHTQETADMVTITSLQSAINAAKARLAKAQSTYNAHHKAYLAANKLVQMYKKRVHSNTVVASKAKSTADAQGSAAIQDGTQVTAMTKAETAEAAKKAKDETARKNSRTQATKALDKYRYWQARAKAASNTAKFYHKLAVQQHGYAIKYHGKWRQTRKRAAAAQAKATKFAAEAKKYMAKLQTHSSKKVQDRTAAGVNDAKATQAQINAATTKATLQVKQSELSKKAAEESKKAKTEYTRASRMARIAARHRKKAKTYDAAYKSAQSKATAANTQADVHRKAALKSIHLHEVHTKAATTAKSKSAVATTHHSTTATATQTKTTTTTKK